MMGVLVLYLLLVLPIALLIAAALWNVDALDRNVPVPCDLLLAAVVGLLTDTIAAPLLIVGLGLFLRYLARQRWPRSVPQDRKPPCP